MKKVLLIVFLLLTPSVALAADPRCASLVSWEEAGLLMANICEECWTQGNCQLEDILQVFANVSMYILTIVGSLALLLFVIGGFYWLIASGSSDRITKGKKYMTGATVGLLIVFVAYLGVQTLATALQTGELVGTSDFDVCSGANDGVSGATRSQCYQGMCVSICGANSEMASSCFDPENIPTGITSCGSGATSCPNEEYQCCVVYTPPST